MRLTVVGCAGSFAAPDSAASCYLVQATDPGDPTRTWSVVLDLGSGALGPLQRYCDPGAVDLLGLSHLHPDHVADVSGLYVFRKYRPERASGSPPRAPLTVLGPVGTADRLGAAYGLAAGESMDDQLTVAEWRPGVPVVVGPLRITPVPVEHPVPAFGLRVEGPSRADPGATVTLAYTGDTDECGGLDELARDVDLLVAEAAFVEGRDELRGIHLTGRRAGEAAARAGARSLLLTHIPSWNPRGAAEAEARGVYGGPVAVAHAGLVVDL